MITFIAALITFLMIGAWIRFGEKLFFPATSRWRKAVDPNWSTEVVSSLLFATLYMLWPMGTQITAGIYYLLALLGTVSVDKMLTGLESKYGPREIIKTTTAKVVR